MNGNQGWLAPRGTANAVTGEVPALNNTCYSDPPEGQEDICGRLQAATADLDDVSATYFVELQALTPCEDLRNNNPSYREIEVTRPTQPCTCGEPDCTYSIAGAPGSTTIVGDPAIKAWKAADPSVVETEIYVQEDVSANETNCECESGCQVEDNSLLILAAKATDLGNGSWAYEYALYNMNSHRGVRSFTVPLVDGTTVCNIDFNDVDYHSGEAIDDTDWATSGTSTSLTWQTDDYSTNPNANALR